MSGIANSRPQPVITVALLGLNPECAEVFRAAFREFSMETRVLQNGDGQALEDYRFEACVVSLAETSAPGVDAVRSSRCNGAIPILGVCNAGANISSFARLGLNVILKEPVDLPEAVKAIRATHLLILHELRRHVRIPVVLEISMEITEGGRFNGLTRNLSYGGVLLSTDFNIAPDHTGELNFFLPNGSPVQVTGTIVWRRHPDLLGIRFDAQDQRRSAVGLWIDEYLQEY